MASDFFLNGIDVISLAIESDTRGWFAEFELSVDGQLVEDQDVVLTDGSLTFIGHVNRYDPETSQGLITAGPASLYRDIAARWIDGKLSSALSGLGIDAVVQTEMTVSCLVSAGTRLDAVKSICNFIKSNWRLLPDGRVFIGNVETTTITEDLIYNVDYPAGRVTVRGMALMPAVVDSINKTPVATRWDWNADQTTLDLANDCDLISQITRMVARETDAVACRAGTVTGQSGNTCTVIIDGQTCRNVQICWGIPGFTAQLKLNAQVICVRIAGKPYVIAWNAADVDSWTISGGSDQLALSTPILNWMQTATAWMIDMADKHDKHLHSGNGAPPTNMISPTMTRPLPIDTTIKSIVRAR